MSVFYYFISFVIIISCANIKISVMSQAKGKTVIEEFNAMKDAEALHKAVDGIGTDERTIVEIIPKRTPEEIIAIKLAYESMYKKDLTKALKGDISGTFRNIILALMEQPYEYLVKELDSALKGTFKIDYNRLNEILCTREDIDLQTFKSIYNNVFNRSLLTTFEEKLSGDYKIFIETLFTSPMRETKPVNRSLIPMQVQSIPDSASNNSDCSVSNSNLMQLMAKESFNQIRIVLHEYERIRGNTVESALEKYCKKPLADAYITVVEFAKNPALYYAKLLNKAMAGIGTDENALTRIIVSKKSVPLHDIKNMYYATYKTLLAASIVAETSGSFQKVLMMLTGYDI